MRSIILSLALAAALLGGGRANAAFVTHIYDLNGSYADSLGGPSLNPNGGTLGASGYTFGAGQGPNVSNALTGYTDNYSIELTFKFDAVSGYRRVIDFKNLTSDTGLYTLNGNLDFYNVTSGSGAPVTANTFHNVVLTRDGATDTVKGYVDGVLQFSFIDSSNLAVFDQSNSIAHFFRDNTSGGAGGENGTGVIDRIRIYDGALSGSQVAALNNGGDPPGNPVPAPASVMLLASAAPALAAVCWLRRRGRALQAATA